LCDAQGSSDVSRATVLQMGLEQQTVHLAAFGLLLRLDLMKGKLQGTPRRQPSFQHGEFEGGG
jgi:hypothetical protein